MANTPSNTSKELPKHTDRIEATTHPDQTQQALFVRPEELLDSINEGLAMSIGFLLTGQKNVKDMKNVQSKLNNNVPSFKSLSQVMTNISDSLSGINKYLTETNSIESLLNAINANIYEGFLGLPNFDTEHTTNIEQNIQPNTVISDTVSGNIDEIKNNILTIKNVLSGVENKGIYTQLDTIIGEITKLNTTQPQQIENTIIATPEHTHETARLEIELKGLENVNTLAALNALSEISKNATGANNNLDAFIDGVLSLDKLKEIQLDASTDTQKIQTILEQVNKIITNGDIGFSGLISNIDNVFSGSDVSKSIKNFELLMSSVGTIINIVDNIGVADKSVEINNLQSIIKSLISLTDVNGEIDTLIKNIAKTGINSKNAMSNIDVISSLLDAVIKVGDMGFFKVLRAQVNIKIISKFIVSSVTSIIKELQRAERISNAKEVQDSLKVVETFFNTALVLANMDLRGKRRQMFINIEFLKRFIVGSVVDIVNSLNEAKQISENQSKAIAAIQGLFDNIIKIGDFSFMKILKMKLRFAYFCTIFDIIEDVLEQIPTNTNLQECLQNIIMTGKLFDTVSNWNIPSIMALLSMSVRLTQLIANVVLIQSLVLAINNTAKTIKKENRINEITQYFNQLKDLFNTINVTAIASNQAARDARLIQKNVNEIEQTAIKNGDTAKKAKFAMKPLSDFMKVIILSATMLLFAGMIIMLFPSLIAGAFAFAVTLGAFILAMSVAFRIAQKGLKNELKGLKEFTKLIVISAAVLMLGSIMYSLIDQKSLFGFAITLGVFILTMVAVLAISSKPLRTIAMPALKDFAILIVASGMTLALGAAIYHFINWGDLIGFAVTLGLFIWGMIAVLGASKPAIHKIAMPALRDFAILIVASGMTLALGAAIYHFINWGDLIGFTITLALFILSMIAIYTVAGILMAVKHGGPLEGLKDFAILIVASGMVLALGAAIYHFINWGDLIGFTIMLALFIAAVTFTYAFASKMSGKAMKGLRDFTLLVVASAVVLLLGGGLLMAFPNLWMYVAGFGVMLAAFVGGLTWVYAKNAKKIEKAFLPALGLAILTAISALTLLYAGKQIAKNPEILEAAVKFAILLVIYVGFMAFVCKLMGKNWGAIAAGEGLMLGIIVLTWLAGKVFASLLKVIKRIDKFGKDKFLLGIGTMFTVLGAFVLAAVCLGALVTGAGAIILVAGAAFTALLGIVYLTAKAINAIADSVQQLNKIKGADFKKLGGIIKGYIGLAKSLTDFSVKDYVKIRITANALSSMGKMISNIAENIKDYAELKVPVYTGTKKTGYRSLTNKDFTSAANNVKKIITVLGNAVLATYKANPQIFERDWRGNTPFAIVSKSLGKLGPMISSIAHGVKEYADMRIPVFDTNGKKTGYRNLTDTDYSNAATNVNKIITTLGAAVLNTYQANPDMFVDPLIGSTPFARVAKSLGKLGPMISDIAKGVCAYALGVPQYTEKDGKLVVTGYKPFTNENFTEARDRIKDIIETLGYGIMDSYDEHPDWYENAGLFGLSTVFAKVISANSKLGSLISSIARGVQYFAAGYYPDVTQGKDEKGNWKAYSKMKSEDYILATAMISTVISVLGSAVMKSYEDNPDWYEETGNWFSKTSIFGRVIDTQAKLGTLISRISKAVQTYASGKFVSEYDEKGNPRKYERLGEEQFKEAGRAITSVIGTIGESIVNVVRVNPEWFDDGDDSEFVVASNAIANMGGMVSNIAKAIHLLSTASIPTYNSEGKIIGATELKPETYKAAGETLSDCIVAIGKGIIETVTKNPKYFNDGDDSEFVTACTALGNMGNIVNTLAQGIVLLSTASVPIWGTVDGKPAIIGSEKITESMLKQAGDTLSICIGAIGEGICGAIAKNEEYFDDSEDSEFVVACAALGNMGNLVKNIADAIVMLGTATIPTFDEKGVVNGSKQIDLTASVEAAKTALTSIITCIGSTLIDTVVNNPEIFNEDGPFTVACEAIGSMGNLVHNIAEAVQMLATASIPVFDKKGKIIGATPIDYTVAIPKSQKAIKSIITAIGDAIIGIIDDPDYKDWFIMRQTKTGEAVPAPFAVACDALGAMGGLVSSIADTVIKFGTATIPVYKDGKIVDYKKLTDTELNSAKDTIANILTTMGNAITNVIKTHPGYFKKDGLFATACTALSNMGEFITSIATAVSIFAKGGAPKFENGIIVGINPITDDDVKNASAAMTGIMSAAVDAVYKLIQKPAWKNVDPSKLADKFKGINNIITSITSGATNVINSLTQAGLEIGAEYDFSQPVTSFVESLKKILEKLNEKVGGTGIFKDTVFECLEKLGDSDDVTKGVNILNRIIAGFKTTNQKAQDVDNANLGKVVSFLYATDSTNKDNNLNRVLQVLNRVLPNIKKLGKDSKEIKSGTQSLIGIIQAFIKVSNKLNDLKSIITENGTSMSETITTFGGLVQQIINSVDIENINDKIKAAKDINGIINNFAGIMSSIDDVEISSTGVLLTESIDKIYKKVLEVDAAKTINFRSLNNTLKDFVNNAINSLDVTRVDKLIDLITAMNNLAAQTGGLDKLTNTITTTLADTLNNLTTELGNSAKQFKVTETIQKNRHKLIDKSIKDLKEIMGKEIIVKVSTEQEPDNNPDDTGGGNGNSNSQKTSDEKKQNTSPSPTGGGSQYSRDGETNDKKDKSQTPAQKPTPQKQKITTVQPSPITKDDVDEIKTKLTNIINKLK